MSEKHSPMHDISHDTGAQLPNFISIIVGTYNRAAKLSQCIDSLLAMSVPDSVGWELICVDNNSTDNTKQVIEKFATRSAIPIHYVFKKSQGISHARNAGLKLARGDIIAVTDDDCIADPNWLKIVWEEFRSDPALSMLGGRIELYNKGDLPVSIRTIRERVAVTPERVFGIVNGCNLAFHKRTISKIGLYDTALGPGTSIPAAEDWDFIWRVLKAGFKIGYSPDALVYHDHGRRTELELEKITKAYVVGRSAFYLKHSLHGDRQIMRMAYWEYRPLIRGAIWNAIIRKAGDNREARFLWYHIIGAVEYFRVCIRRLVGQTP